MTPDIPLPRGPDLKEHDPRGPSTLGRLIGCPASYDLSKGEPNLETEWSRDGDECHYVVSLYFANMKLDSKDYIDE